MQGGRQPKGIKQSSKQWRRRGPSSWYKEPGKGRWCCLSQVSGGLLAYQVPLQNTYFRQGDAAGEPRDRDWDPQTDAKATTLSRNASGRGSIRKPALTKAALMRLAAGEKKAEEEEKKRQKSEFGREGSSLDLLRNRSVTPSNSLITRSAYVPSSNYSDYNSRSENSRSKSKTPQLSRRSSSRCRLI